MRAIKLTVLSSVVMFLLSACGGGSSSDSNLQSNTSKPKQQASVAETATKSKYVRFDFAKENDNEQNEKLTYFQKVETVFHDGIKYDTTPKGILGNAVVNLYKTHRFNSDFYIITTPKLTKYGYPVSYVSSMSDTFEKSSPYNDKGLKPVVTTVQYTIKDIANVSKSQLPVSSLIASKKIPNTVVFPAGSTCRVISSMTVDTPTGRDKGVFTFFENSKARTAYTNLQDWKEAMKTKLGTVQKEKEERILADGQSVDVSFVANKATFEIGTLYNGRVYDTQYALEGSNSTVNNLLSSICFDYNPVAANFIENTIKKYEK